MEDISDDKILDLSLNFLHSSTEDPFDEEAWKALNNFLLRPYWKRIWIIQEVSLARSAVILFGTKQFPYRNLETACALWESLFKPHQRHRLSQIHLATLIASWWREILIFGRFKVHPSNERLINTTLLELAQSTTKFEATDPRDKIYGILGLLSDEILPVQPDYNRTVSQVYMDAVFSDSEPKNQLKFLCMRGLESFRSSWTLELPSWVPDFTRDHHLSSMVRFNASGDSVADYHFSPDSGLLQCLGLTCDEIEEPAEWSSINRYQYDIDWLSALISDNLSDIVLAPTKFRRGSPFFLAYVSLEIGAYAINLLTFSVFIIINGIYSRNPSLYPIFQTFKLFNHRCPKPSPFPTYRPSCPREYPLRIITHYWDQENINSYL